MKNRERVDCGKQRLIIRTLTRSVELIEVPESLALRLGRPRRAAEGRCCEALAECERRDTLHV